MRRLKSVFIGKPMLEKSHTAGNAKIKNISYIIQIFNHTAFKYFLYPFRHKGFDLTDKRNVAVFAYKSNADFTVVIQNIINVLKESAHLFFTVCRRIQIYCILKFLQKLAFEFSHHTVYIGIVQIESRTVNINLFNQLFYRDFLYAFFLCKYRKSVPQRRLCFSYTPVCSYCHNLFTNPQHYYIKCLLLNISANFNA